MLRKYLLLITILSVFMLLSACQPGRDSTGKDGKKVPDHLLTFENLTVFDEDAVPAATIRIEKLVQYPGEENIHFAQIHTIDVDDEGNVYIADIADGSAGIHVFSADGSYIGKTGRDGDGPGELRGLMDIHISGDSLYTLDMSLERVQIFSLPDRILRDIVMYDSRELINDPPPGSMFQFEYPVKLLSAGDGSILILFARTSNTIDTLLVHRVNHDGMLVQKDIQKTRHVEWLGAPDVPLRFPALFLGQGFIQVTADNHIISANGTEILIKVFNGDGVYQRAFYHPFGNRTLDTSEIRKMHGTEDEVLRQLQRILRHNALPSVGPAFDAMLVDDENRIWIAAIVDDMEEMEWWVMDREGKLQSKFRWPAGRQIKKIANGSIYALDTDPESHEESVGRYEFIME